VKELKKKKEESVEKKTLLARNKQKKVPKIKFRSFAWLVAALPISKLDSRG